MGEILELHCLVSEAIISTSCQCANAGSGLIDFKKDGRLFWLDFHSTFILNVSYRNEVYNGVCEMPTGYVQSADPGMGFSSHAIWSRSGTNISVTTSSKHCLLLVFGKRQVPDRGSHRSSLCQLVRCCVGNVLFVYIAQQVPHSQDGRGTSSDLLFFLWQWGLGRPAHWWYARYEDIDNDPLMRFSLSSTIFAHKGVSLSHPPSFFGYGS